MVNSDPTSKKYIKAMLDLNDSIISNLFYGL